MAVVKEMAQAHLRGSLQQILFWFFICVCICICVYMCVCILSLGFVLV